MTDLDCVKELYKMANECLGGYYKTKDKYPSTAQLYLDHYLAHINAIKRITNLIEKEVEDMYKCQNNITPLKD